MFEYEFFAKRLPVGLLFGSIFIWIVVLGKLVLLRHNKFATFDFDLGIHDQSLWLLAHGQWFNTVCGLPVFGHHAMFMYYFLVPLVWLGGGPNLWNILQVVALALAAIPVFLIARRRIQSDWAALALGIAWLLLPTTSFLAWETFHPETMALPFLLMGYHYATCRPEGFGRHVTRHNIITVAWLAVAMLWKEDISLAVIGIGILLLFRNRRRFSLIVIGSASLYFLVIAVWLVPQMAGDQSSYGALYGQLGSTPFEVAKNTVTNPSLFIDRLQENNFIGYIGQITSPLAFMPLLAPLTFLMSIPQIFINILTTSNFTWAMQYHYQAVPVAASIVGAIEGVAFVKRHNRLLGKLSLSIVLIASLISAHSWSLLPYAKKFDSGYWPNRGGDTSGWEAALERVGPEDVVSAHYSFVPHASQRKVIYTFPNPWIKSNFLNDDSKFVSPSKVKWIVIADDSLGAEPQSLLNELLSTGEYGDPQTIAGVTSYRRLLSDSKYLVD